MKPTKEVKLYELEKEWLTLESLLKENEGEITLGVESLMEKLEKDFSENFNADKYLYVLKMLKTNLEVFDQTSKIYEEKFVKPYKTKSKQAKNGYENLKKRIENLMDKMGLDEITGDQYTGKLVKSKDVLEWIEPNQETLKTLKEEYPELVDVTYSVNKDKLRNMLEKKEDVPINAFLKENKYLRIS